MRRQAVLTASLVLILSAVAAPVSQARTSGTDAMREIPGGVVPVLAGHTTQRLRPIHAPLSASITGSAVSGLGASGFGASGIVATADIQVTYNGFSQDAQDAFEAAVIVWESMIVSSKVIHVNANWTPLGANVLGSAGPASIYVMDDDRVYAAALAEAICDCEGSNPNEINANFNSAFGSWYLGTDGNPPSNKWDFYTVVLHELGHGLGFFSSFGVSGTDGFWGYTSNDYPLRYDEHEWSAASGGNKLTDTSAYANPSAALKTQLTDTTVYFGGPNVVAALGGRARLYAPSGWQGGSSNSHFDETTFSTGTQHALMTPSLSNGEVIHDPGPVTLALFRDIGWTTSDPTVPTEPGAPTGVTAAAGNASADVSWTAPGSDGGDAITSYTATSTPDGFTCETATTSCTVNGLTNGTPYTFTVTAMNGVGTSPASNPSNSVTPSSEPPDTTGPTVDLPAVAIVAPQVLGSTAALRVSWAHASDPSGVSAYELQRKKGSGAWVSVTLATPISNTADVAITPGSTYRFRLRAVDGASNTGPWATTAPAVLTLAQETASAIAYGGTWKSGSVQGSSGGKVRYQGTAGRAATLTFTGTSAAFVSTRSAARGIAQIWLDGVFVGSVDLYAAVAVKKAVVWAPSSPLAAGVHTLEVRVTGTKNPSATQSRIDVDAFLVWP